MENAQPVHYKSQEVNVFKKLIALDGDNHPQYTVNHAGGVQRYLFLNQLEHTLTPVILILSVTPLTFIVRTLHFLCLKKKISYT